MALVKKKKILFAIWISVYTCWRQTIPVYAKTHCTLVHPNSRQQTDHEGNRNDSALLLLGYIAGFDERSLYIYWRAYTPPEYCTSCNVGNHVRLGYTLCIRLSYLSNRAVSTKTTETSILSKAKQNIFLFSMLLQDVFYITSRVVGGQRRCVLIVTMSR